MSIKPSHSERVSHYCGVLAREMGLHRMVPLPRPDVDPVVLGDVVRDGADLAALAVRLLQVVRLHRHPGAEDERVPGEAAPGEQ